MSDFEITSRLRASISDASNPGVILRRVAEEVLRLLPQAELASVVCTAGGGAPIRREARAGGDAGPLPCSGAKCRFALRHDGERIGTLTVGSSRAGAFLPEDRAAIVELVEVVSTVIGCAVELARVSRHCADELRRPTSTVGGSVLRARQAAFVANLLEPGLADVCHREMLIQQTIRRRDFSIVAQPVVNLATGGLFAVEALSRFPGCPAWSPDRWFAEAAAVGLGVELELTAVRLALSHLDQVPKEALLAVNVGLEALVAPELYGLLRDSRPERLMVEVTEQSDTCGVEGLPQALERLRCLGVSLAVDDAGKGYAGFGRILELHPDVIKLDRELARDLTECSAGSTVIRAVVGVARELGAAVVIEGIETQDQMEAAHRLGIDHAQGYLLGRPSDVDALPRHFLNRSIRSGRSGGSQAALATIAS